jgi:hypothetical protein
MKLQEAGSAFGGLVIPRLLSNSVFGGLTLSARLPSDKVSLLQGTSYIRLHGLSQMDPRSKGGILVK